MCWWILRLFKVIWYKGAVVAVIVWLFWIYNYLCNHCLSPLILCVLFSIRARCTTLCDKVCQWLATSQWFSLVSTTNKTDRHDITEILLKVALNTIKQTNQKYQLMFSCLICIILHVSISSLTVSLKCLRFLSGK
jgi:hypothetical protein